MKFCALKANGGGFTGKLPERPRVGTPRGGGGGGGGTRSESGITGQGGRAPKDSDGRSAVGPAGRLSPGRVDPADGSAEPPGRGRARPPRPAAGRREANRRSTAGGRKPPGYGQRMLGRRCEPVKRAVQRRVPSAGRRFPAMSRRIPAGRRRLNTPRVGRRGTVNIR